jgi:hypothetical protein
MIIKKKKGVAPGEKSGQYNVVSSKGDKNLGSYGTLEAAKDRLKQVEFFKYLSRKKNKK